MYQKNVRLHEAMTSSSVSIWEVSGLQVKLDDISENISQFKTFVMKLSDDHYLVGVEGKDNDDTAVFMQNVAEFSTLEGMQKLFPHLFELDGDLYVISF